jgi:hypothetical protein
VSKQKRGKHYIKPRPQDFEEAEKAEHERDNEDIYESDERERLLEDDEITAAEEGFMRGRDEPPSKRETRRKSHDDSISVELSKQDAEDD